MLNILKTKLPHAGRIVCALAMAATGATAATADEPLVLVKGAEQQTPLASQTVADPNQPNQYILRTRAVDVAPTLLQNLAAQNFVQQPNANGTQPNVTKPKPRVTLELFPDAIYTATLDRVETDKFGTTTAWGSLEGEDRELSRVILTATSEMLLATIYPINEKGSVINIHYRKQQNRHEAVETDVASMPPSTDIELPEPKKEETK